MPFATVSPGANLSLSLVPEDNSGTRYNFLRLTPLFWAISYLRILMHGYLRGLWQCPNLMLRWSVRRLCQCTLVLKACGEDPDTALSKKTHELVARVECVMCSEKMTHKLPSRSCLVMTWHGRWQWVNWDYDHQLNQIFLFNILHDIEVHYAEEKPAKNGGNYWVHKETLRKCVHSRWMERARVRLPLLRPISVNSWS